MVDMDLWGGCSGENASKRGGSLGWRGCRGEGREVSVGGVVMDVHSGVEVLDVE